MRPANLFVSNTHFSDSINYSPPARTSTAPSIMSILACPPHREFMNAYVPHTVQNLPRSFSACRTPNTALSSSSRVSRVPSTGHALSQRSTWRAQTAARRSPLGSCNGRQTARSVRTCGCPTSHFGVLLKTKLNVCMSTAALLDPDRLRLSFIRINQTSAICTYSICEYVSFLPYFLRHI